MEMTPRERLIATVKFEPVDRPVRWEATGFWRETLERWWTEGLPETVDEKVGAWIHNGFDIQLPVVMGAHEHAGLDPVFDEEVVEEDGRHIIKRDMSGSLVRVFKDGASTPPTHIGSPVSDRKSWEEIKTRLDPDTPGRIAAAMPFIDVAKKSPLPLNVIIPGLFGAHRHLFGFDKLMLSYYDQPDLVRDISAHWARMWKRVIAKVAELQRPDAVSLWEDMCGRNGPLIGPKTFKEFMSPYYKDLVDFVRFELGVPVVGVDTDGDMTKLIPLFVEAGVNLLWPFEVQAGMDVLKVREQWPNQFAIWGGLDKRALAKSKGEIEQMVRRTVPKMLKRGGYIPSLDHHVPPDVSLENWIFYRDLVRELGKG